MDCEIILRYMEENNIEYIHDEEVSYLFSKDKYENLKIIDLFLKESEEPYIIDIDNEPVLLFDLLNYIN